METFNTGATRSIRMPRYDLIPPLALDRLAKRFTGSETENGPDGGALKYGECNWTKGLPTSDVINHIMNHFLNYINCFQTNLTNGITLGLEGPELMNFIRHSMVRHSEGDDDLAGVMWGCSVLMYQEQFGMYHDDKFPLVKRGEK